MEAIGAIASSLQIVSQCAQCTVAIAKWVSQVKTVDERIESFSNEVYTLKATFSSLSQSLNDPSLLKSIRHNDYDATGHLWLQVTKNLKDCESTICKINIVLDRIETKSKVARTILKQLNESLNAGELARLRQQIQLFNTGMTLPMQMINLMLQLSHGDETRANQRDIDTRLANLQRTIEDLAIEFSRPRRASTLAGSTAVGDTASEKMMYENMECYIEEAKTFLKTTSAAATSRAAKSSGNQEEGFQEKLALRRGSAWAPLTSAEVSRIESWGNNLPNESLPNEPQTPQTSDAQSSLGLFPDPAADSDDEDDDFELIITKTLLRNGQDHFDQENYAAAEENFRDALEKLHSQEFEGQIACSPADATLLLAQCCIKQQKYDEAVERLLPLSEAISASDPPTASSVSSISQTMTKRTDKHQALFAHHLLGIVYLKKSEPSVAESHVVKAVKGRRKLLGPAHEKTHESLHLAVEVFQSQGREAMADVYKEFLKVPVQKTSAPSPQLSSVPSITTPPIPSSPPAADQGFQLKPKGKFGFLRRGEKSQTAPRPVPTSVPRVSFSHQPSNSLTTIPTSTQFSTSPGSYSTLTSDLSRRASDISVQQNRYSSASMSNPAGWYPLGEDRRTSSESRPRSISIAKSASARSASSKLAIEPKFEAVKAFWNEGKQKEAVKVGMKLLKEYDPKGAILNNRSDELQTNLKKSGNQGMAATGYGFAPIHFFCSLSYEAVTEVEFLIEIGVNPDAVAYKAGYKGHKNADSFTPLILAIERGHQNIVQLLLDAEASMLLPQQKTGFAMIERETLHPLLYACRRGDIGIVSALLDHGADVAEDEFPRNAWHGNSLLHEASWRCDLAMVKFLLDYQRRQRKIGRQQSLSLTTTSAKTLQSSNCAVGRAGQQDIFGMTPMMYAVETRDDRDPQRRAYKLANRIECLRLLFERGCEDSPTDSPSALLSEPDTDDGVVVGRMDSLDLKEKPLGSGQLATDLHLEDKKGHTVFWYAKEEDDAELVKFLDNFSEKSRLIDF